MKHHPTAEMQCPVCTAKLDTATSTRPGDMRGPAPGDFTVCIRCASVLRFAEEGALAHVPDFEVLHPEPRRDLEQAQAIVRKIQGELSRGKPLS